MALNPTNSIIKRQSYELLKEGAEFENDRLDFHDAILTMGDHDAQVDRLMDDVSRTADATDSLKDGQREEYHREQRQSYRPQKASSHFGLDSDVTYIPRKLPPSNIQRTHNSIRLIQQDNASYSKLMNMYNTRFK
jgi:hypothetical protein